MQAPAMPAMPGLTPEQVTAITAMIARHAIAETAGLSIGPDVRAAYLGAIAALECTDPDWLTVARRLTPK